RAERAGGGCRAWPIARAARRALRLARLVLSRERRRHCRARALRQPAQTAPWRRPRYERAGRQARRRHPAAPRCAAAPRRGHRADAVAALTVTSALRGLSAIAKRDDSGGTFLASDDIVAALAQMTDEERTLALIKAARATPLRPMR